MTGLPLHQCLVCYGHASAEDAVCICSPAVGCSDRLCAFSQAPPFPVRSNYRFYVRMADGELQFRNGRNQAKRVLRANMNALYVEDHSGTVVVEKSQLALRWEHHCVGAGDSLLIALPTTSAVCSDCGSQRGRSA